MRIGGLLRLSTLDYPGRLAAVVFTAGCDLRCPWCHNPDLVLPERFPSVIAPEEVLRFLDTRRGKLDGVVVSGGEPTLHPDLPEFVRAVRDLGFPVKLDTNGGRPERLRLLLEEGLLDYVAMDLKGPPGAYERIAGRPVEWNAITCSLHLLRESGLSYELRLTVVPGLHRESDAMDLPPWLDPRDHLALQPYRAGHHLDPTFDAPADPEKELLTHFANCLCKKVKTLECRFEKA